MSDWAKRANEKIEQAQYHKRSNVETVFQIKSKFGERVRSKTETAQINEALYKGAISRNREDETPDA